MDDSQVESPAVPTMEEVPTDETNGAIEEEDEEEEVFSNGQFSPQRSGGMSKSVTTGSSFRSTPGGTGGFSMLNMFTPSGKQNGLLKDSLFAGSTGSSIGRTPMNGKKKLVVCFDSFYFNFCF